MCIWFDAHISRKYCVSDDVFNAPLGMMANLVKCMRFPTNSYSSAYPSIVNSSLGQCRWNNGWWVFLEASAVVCRSWILCV